VTDSYAYLVFERKDVVYVDRPIVSDFRTFDEIRTVKNGSFLFGAKRCRVHETTFTRYGLSTKKQHGLDLIGCTIYLVFRVLGRMALAGDVLALVDEIVNRPRHDGAQRPQARLW